MIRKLFYHLSPLFRFLVRYVAYLPVDLIHGRKNKILPPRRLIYTGRGEFEKQGREWFEFFTGEAGLAQDSAVLDIGSGIGRIALPMMDWLEGPYEGFDAVKVGVDWCRKNISNRKPNFRFQFVDLHNDLYRRKGENAAHFDFPYEKNSFDFVCAISVFTHLLPEETENYFRQIRRVIKPGGYTVLTFFLLDEETQRLMVKNKNGLQFLFHFGHYSLMNLGVRSANVAYQRKYIYDLVEESNLKIIKEIKGSWCGRKKGHYLDFQDILVLQKPARF